MWLILEVTYTGDHIRYLSPKDFFRLMLEDRVEPDIIKVTVEYNYIAVSLYTLKV